MDCCDKYNPINIPKGKNGKSICIAYADDGDGNGFSFTPTETSQYISVIICDVCGTVSQSDFTVWFKITGTDGDDDDGVSIDDVHVSDGVTAIGGNVYPINTLVVELSDSSFVDAGLITVNTIPLVWFNLSGSLVNGWALGAGPAGAPPRISIDPYNFIRLTGVLDSTSASDTVFIDTIKTILSIPTSPLSKGIFAGMPFSIPVTNGISDHNSDIIRFSDSFFSAGAGIIEDYVAQRAAGRNLYNLSALPPLFY